MKEDRTKENGLQGLPGREDLLIVLAGPTAVGKTDLSIKLAKEIGGEIISADSMQVYKGMDIGSAKVTEEEMQGVPHHLIDVLDPDEPFHVVSFQKMAKDAIRQIRERGNIPILTGGTGFYIQAVLYDIDFAEEELTGVRKKLEEMAASHPAGYLHSLLKEKDPGAAAAVHPNNVKRIIRALEYCETTGRKISEHNEEQRQKQSPYRYLYFVLNDHRDLLYERINRRVDLMMEKGLTEEVMRLKEKGYTRNMVSMQGLGYKEILDYLDGRISLDEAVYRIKRDSRHFAKRQLTWFRRERDVIWLNRYEYADDEGILLEMCSRIRELLQKGAQ